MHDTSRLRKTIAAVTLLAATIGATALVASRAEPAGAVTATNCVSGATRTGVAWGFNNSLWLHTQVCWPAGGWMASVSYLDSNCGPEVLHLTNPSGFNGYVHFHAFCDDGSGFRNLIAHHRFRQSAAGAVPVQESCDDWNGISCNSAWQRVPADPPPMPTNVRATLAGTTATVTWSPAAGATRYEVQRWIVDDSVTGLSANATSPFADRNLAAGTAYDYQVRACNASKCSAWSKTSAASKVTTPVALAVPANVTATLRQSGAGVTWTTVPGATRYEVTRDGQTVAANITTPPFTDTSLEYDHTYDYQVRACNASACSGLSAVATLTTPPWRVTPQPPTGMVQGFMVGGDGALRLRIDGKAVTYGGYGDYAVTLPAGRHKVKVEVPAGWKVGYTMCVNSTDCHRATPTKRKAVTIDVPADGFVDLWWHYAQK